MENNTQIISEDEIKKLRESMAMKAGENMQSFESMSVLTVFNGSTRESQFKHGDLVLSTKSDNGYSEESFSKPFKCVVIKTRMYLTTKYQWTEKGLPRYITNEFDSYGDNEVIIVKEKKDDKYIPVFTGNYKQVQEKYSRKDDLIKEGYLELRHAVYVLLEDFNNPKIIKLDCRGMSRGRYMDYMKTFDRKNGEHMVGFWTEVSTVLVDKDYKGRPLRVPAYSMCFEKDSMVSFNDLKQISSIQDKFNSDLQQRDIKFENILEKKQDVKQLEKPVEDIPTINIDEEEAVEIPEEPIKDDSQIRIEDVPF
jgi:hypothetical protein